MTLDVCSAFSRVKYPAVIALITLSFVGGIGAAVARPEDRPVGRPESPGNSANAPGHNKSKNDDGKAVGRTVVLVGLNGAVQSYVRLANFGDHAGTAEVVLHNAETGLELGRWTSPALPPRGAAEVALADIADEALPDGMDIPAVLVVATRASFNGEIQHLGFDDGNEALTDLTACRRLATPRQGLGYVAGPGRSDTSGAIRLLNVSDRAAAATLVVYDAVTGAEAGRWTSPTIASFGSSLFSVATIVDEATPNIDALPAATIGMENPKRAFDLSYLETLPGGTPVDLTAGCELRGGEDDDEGDDDSDDEDDDSDDEDDNQD